MSIIDSFNVPGSGFVIILIVIIALACILKAKAKISRNIEGKKETESADGMDKTVIAPVSRHQNDGPSSGELKLIGVDEKTAAIIMAIVSDQSELPLSELRFKTIRALD